MKLKSSSCEVLVHFLSPLVISAVWPVFQRIRAEFDEFEKLFGRYLQEAGHAIMWDKIRLVSDDLVSILITIQIMYIKNNVDLDFFLN